MAQDPPQTNPSFGTLQSITAITYAPLLKLSEKKDLSNL
jgi:hypothetical protein